MTGDRQTQISLSFVTRLINLLTRLTGTDLLAKTYNGSSKYQHHVNDIENVIFGYDLSVLSCSLSLPPNILNDSATVDIIWHVRKHPSPGGHNTEGKTFFQSTVTLRVFSGDIVASPPAIAEGRYTLILTHAVLQKLPSPPWVTNVPSLSPPRQAVNDGIVVSFKHLVLTLWPCFCFSIQNCLCLYRILSIGFRFMLNSESCAWLNRNKLWFEDKADVFLLVCIFSSYQHMA